MIFLRRASWILGCVTKAWGRISLTHAGSCFVADQGVKFEASAGLNHKSFNPRQKPTCRHCRFPSSYRHSRKAYEASNRVFKAAGCRLDTVVQSESSHLTMVSAIHLQRCTLRLHLLVVLPHSGVPQFSPYGQHGSLVIAQGFGCCSAFF